MERYFRITARFAPGLAALILAACASTGPAPVEDRSLGGPRPAPRSETRAAPAHPSGATYRVQRGDTLYSIAFRNGLDYRELAGWNGIGPPYTIYVGRELKLSAPGRTTTAAAPAAVAARPPGTAPAAAPPAHGAPPPAVPKPTPFEPVAAGPAPNSTPNPPPAPPSASSAPPVPASAATPAVAATPVGTTPAATTPPPASAPAPAAAAPVAAGDVAWRWPADGQLVGTFVGGDQTKQGIDIAGKAGDPVRAAADGSVVYSGNGLIGYGELIIVKHSPGFLSAYGHNRKRLVKEGDRVKSGQVIAEMGSSSASRDSLHFEIRKNGKPANPLDYLPRR